MPELPGRAGGRPAQHAHGRLGFPAAALPRAPAAVQRLLPCRQRRARLRAGRGRRRRRPGSGDPSRRLRRSPARAAASVRRRAWTRATGASSTARWTCATSSARSPTAPPGRAPSACRAAPPWRSSAPGRRGFPAPTTWRDSAIRVTVLESAPELGGLLRTGIPEYRLPRPVLEREIDFILGHGVEARTGHRVDRAGLAASGARACRRAGRDGAPESARPRYRRRDGRRRRAGPGLPRTRARAAART